MTSKQILIEAKQTLIDKGWCQGSYAKDANGGFVSEFNPEACRFCMWGALNVATAKVLGSSVDPLKGEALSSLRRCVGNVPKFNDEPGRTLPEVLAVFDKAIENCPE